MFGTEYYNRAIDNTVTGFGTLFNNIKIFRRDPTTGEVLQKQRVPLAYGPRAKFETRLEQNPELQKKAITLPFMYFEMTGLSRDCLLYTSPSPRDKRQSRMPSSA